MSILGKALQPVAKKIGTEVAESLAPKAAKVIDEFADWGWKGGKPGEVIGSKYVKKADSLYTKARNAENQADFAYSNGEPALGKKLDAVASRADEAYLQVKSEAEAQLEDAAFKGKFLSNWDDTDQVMFNFKRLEELVLPNGKIGLPRNLTGKVMQAFGGKLGTDEEVIQVAKEIQTLSPTELNTMRSLADEWVGSAIDLVRAAKLL